MGLINTQTVINKSIKVTNNKNKNLTIYNINLKGLKWKFKKKMRSSY